ncbi:MAG: glycosyltransferase family 2 protein [Bacteroidales bacterium]|nr:glycosyltransferase family 2 protein [Bacteroidales bacterium]
MYKEPLISIIVPIYKVEKYLDKCIQSLVNQTYKNIEIILVDDGSPDNCGRMCDEYAAKDNRIKVIHKENGGLAAARNSGQDAMTGFAMMFIDGDDYLEPDCCEKTINAMLKHDVDLVMFTQFTNYPNSQIVEHSFHIQQDEIVFTSDDCRELQARILDFNGKIGSACMKLMRTDYLRKFNIRHIDALSQGAEGFVFNIQFFEHLEKACYIDYPLYHYIYNPSSMTHTSCMKYNLSLVKCMEWIAVYIQQSLNANRLNAMLLNRMLYVICTVAISGCFNPYNESSHDEKVAFFVKFMQETLVDKAMKYASRKNIGFQRKIILMLIRAKQYRLLELLGYLRRKQLENK